MKITYPECQLEISAEELITVIDHFTTKVTCNTEPTFEPGGIVGTGDDMPKPKPNPNMLDNEAIIPRGSGFQDLIKKGLEEAEAQDKLPEDPLEGIDFPDQPKPETEDITVTYKRKLPKDMERSKRVKSIKRDENNRWKKRKVDIKIGNEWHTFDSVADAAKFIGCRQYNLSTALNAEKNTYKGYEVRFHVSDNPNQPELDAVLAEIKERDKQPYQPDNKR